jgi:hypothetical protein
VLQHLSQGRPFNQNVEGHTFQQFEALAKIREEGDQLIDWTNDKEVYKHIEKPYWEKVENQIGEEEKVEYAADLNANMYGNGFGMPHQPLQDAN